MTALIAIGLFALLLITFVGGFALGLFCERTELRGQRPDEMGRKLCEGRGINGWPKAPPRRAAPLDPDPSC